MSKKHKYITRYCLGCKKPLYVRTDSSRIFCDECKKLGNIKVYSNPHFRSIATRTRNKNKVYCGISQLSSLCWYCNNAYGGCSWSSKFKPVDGWHAIRNDINVSTFDGQTYGTRQEESYVILDCPQFQLDIKFSDEYALYSKEETIKKLENRLKQREIMTTILVNSLNKKGFSQKELKYIGDKIAKKRIESGHTQQKMAEILRMDFEVYKQWESGDIPSKDAIKILRLIGAALNYDYRNFIP